MVGGEFKWRHFAGEVILLCMRWYCRYGISYRDLEEMMGERNVAVDHTTLYRWVQQYAPELEEADAVVPEPAQRLVAGRRNLPAGVGSPSAARRSPHRKLDSCRCYAGRKDRVERRMIQWIPRGSYGFMGSCGTGIAMDRIARTK